MQMSAWTPDKWEDRYGSFVLFFLFFCIVLYCFVLCEMYSVCVSCVCVCVRVCEEC